MMQDRRIGYNCSYMPVEILHSLGFEPYRVEGLADAPKVSDSYLHTNMCGYVKGVLDAASDGGNKKIIFVDCCESQRRLWDVWRHFVDNSFPVIFPLPRNKDELAVRFFAGAMKDFISLLEEASGQRLDSASLRHSIKLYNRWRQALQELERLLLQDRISSVDYLRLSHYALNAPVEEASRRVADFTAENEGADSLESEYRVLLSGSQMPLTAAVAIAQTVLDNGANIVYFDTCFTSRYYQGRVDEDGDPLESLAHAYLQRPPCARMPYSQERFPLIQRIVEENNVDGIVYHTLKFCDLFVYEAPTFKEYFESRGVPHLRLETDYDHKLPGQSRTRLEAFLEML